MTRAQDLLSSAGERERDGDYANALSLFDQVASEFGAATEPGLRERVAFALLGRARMLSALGRGGVVAALDELVLRFGNDEAPGVRRIVVAAVFSKAERLEAAGRYGDALTVWDESILRFTAGHASEVQSTLLEALAGKARSLTLVDRPAEAVAACDELLARVGETATPAAGPFAAAALTTKARALRRLGRHEDALRAVDELLARFGGASEPAIRLQVAEGLWERGLVFSQTDRRELAAGACEELVERFFDETEPRVLGVVARAMVQKAFNIEMLGRLDDAIVNYGHVVKRLAGVTFPDVRDKVAEARINAAILIARTRDVTELTEELASDVDPDRLALVARAIVTEGDWLLDSDSPDEALELLDTVIEALEGRSEQESRKVTALALTSKSVALGQLGYDDAMVPFETMIDLYGGEALAAFDEQATRLWSAVEPSHVQRLGWVLLTKARILHALGRQSESKATLTQLLQRLEGNSSPEISNTVAAAHQALQEYQQV